MATTTTRLGYAVLPGKPRTPMLPALVPPADRTAQIPEDIPHAP